MPIPDLTLLSGRTNRSVGVGAPVNGVQEVAHNWDLDPDQIEEDPVLVLFQALGASVTAATYTGLSADKLRLVLNVTQTGGDSLSVDAHLPHTAIR